MPKFRGLTGLTVQTEGHPRGLEEVWHPRALLWRDAGVFSWHEGRVEL